MERVICLPDFVQITRSYDSKSRWADIAKQIAAGNNGYLNVGDSIRCTLKDGSEATFDVLALNPYQPNSAVLGFRDLHWEMVVNEERTNAGGWRDCKMRKDFESVILPLLPDDLVASIIPRKIVQRLRGSELESTDKIWAPSYTEVFGTDRGTDLTGDVGDTQFEFFKSKKNRIKFFKDDVNYWWLRSPLATHSTGFWGVSYGGYMGYYGATNSGGVCPCFIISLQ